jgi:alanine dehydrogenase
MKEYIRDDGKVRCCESNIAKMNVIEYMYHMRFRLWQNIVTAIKEFLDSWSILVNMLLIVALPIYYPIMAIQHIRSAKKAVKECSTEK